MKEKEERRSLAGETRAVEVLTKFTPRATLDADPTFLRAVAHVASALVQKFEPEELHMIKVKNWFDHKWLRFSGKGRINFESPFLSDQGVALDEFHSDTTFPPFSPRRILEQQCFQLGDKGRDVWAVHPTALQNSSWNLHRRVAEATDSGVFVWYSSNSKKNRRGSVMVIEVRGDVVTRWYASLLGEASWRLGLVKGTGRATAMALLRGWPEPGTVNLEPGHVR